MLPSPTKTLNRSFGPKLLMKSFLASPDFVSELLGQDTSPPHIYTANASNHVYKKGAGPAFQGTRRPLLVFSDRFEGKLFIV
jgi:hypothetical protein